MGARHESRTFADGPIWVVAKTLADLLGDEPPGHQKCAFAVNLVAHVKTTNGAGTLTNLNDSETAAFAAEIV